MAKIYRTSRIGNDGKRYDGINIFNRQFEMKGKTINGPETKKFAVPGFAKAKATVYDSSHHGNSTMTGVYYGNKNAQIKKMKSVVRETPRKTVIKTTKYGPITSSYGSQKKSTTRQVIRK